MKRQTRPFTVEIRSGNKRRPAPASNPAATAGRNAALPLLSAPMLFEERSAAPARAESGDRGSVYETALSEADRVFGGPARRPGGPAPRPGETVAGAHDDSGEMAQPRILPDLVSAALEEARQREELETAAAARRVARVPRPERTEAVPDETWAAPDETWDETWPDDADVAVRRARPTRKPRPVRAEAKAPAVDAAVAPVEAEAAPGLRPVRRRNPSAPLARSERWKQRRLPKACW